MKYKLIKKYPGSCYTIGTIVDTEKLNIIDKTVFILDSPEEYPEFWEEVVENMVVFDTYGKYYYHKHPNGKWRCHGQYNQISPVDTIEYTIQTSNPRYIVKNEKVVEKDYEILSISKIATQEVYTVKDWGEDGAYLKNARSKNFNISKDTLEYINEHFHIYSVKRLSDGK